jgi:hypothetical protein
MRIEIKRYRASGENWELDAKVTQLASPVQTKQAIWGLETTETKTMGS